MCTPMLALTLPPTGTLTEELTTEMVPESGWALTRLQGDRVDFLDILRYCYVSLWLSFCFGEVIGVRNPTIYKALHISCNLGLTLYSILIVFSAGVDPSTVHTRLVF